MMYDAIIIGGGHNGLVAACYLAKAGKKVLVLEKNNYFGGASTSQKVFPSYEANLSRYAYLLSLFPTEIFKELDLNVKLLQRNIASYTPYFQNNNSKGLIISNIDENISHKSVLDLGFGESEWQGYKTLLAKQNTFAEMVWESFLQPLRSKASWQKYFNQKGQSELWNSFVEEPIGKLIESHLQSDILRGVFFTDGKIGSYTHAHDESLLQNRTYLYHIIGNKTGEWQVPEGGMGNLANQLLIRALRLGVELKTEAEVSEIHLGKDSHEVYFRQNEKDFAAKATYILSNVAPQVLDKLIGRKNEISKKNTVDFAIKNEGTAFKINMLLRKLPKLKDTNILSEDAFAGTFHINQRYTQLEQSFSEAILGKIPETLAGEIYCHTLTDASILSKNLQEKGFHTLTFFGFDLPYELFKNDNENTKKIVVSKFLAGINNYLAEPLEDCLALDSEGNFCLEAKSSYDLEKELGMPRGNIFHTDLSWFYSDNENSWGVETEYNRVLICGSGAIRGGAVSGISGRNAAMKVLGL